MNAEICRSIESWWTDNLAGICSRFRELLEIDTTSPHEPAAFPLLERLFSEVDLECRRLPFPAELARDELRSLHPVARTSPERSIIRGALRTPCPKQRALLFSAHVDVTPPSARMPDPFRPRLIDGEVWGRGACDTKGNIIVLLEALRFVKQMGLEPVSDVLVDLVIEEEIGGNGALASVLSGIQADGVVCLEPTGLRVFRGHRGCLALDLECRAAGAHMGAAAAGAGAIELACTAVAGLKRIEAEWIREMHGHPAFAEWPRPTQINVGTIRGGEWHGSAAEHCVLGINVGFAPWQDIRDLPEILEDQLVLHCPELSGKICLRRAGIANDAYLTDESAWVVAAAQRAASTVTGRREAACAWNVSCDARLYANIAKIPTVIFGAGALECAHSADERIALQDMLLAVKALVLLLTSAH